MGSDWSKAGAYVNRWVRTLHIEEIAAANDKGLLFFLVGWLAQLVSGSHGACTVRCFWNIHPASTPLNSPHRTTPRVPISAALAGIPGIFIFCSDACHGSQAPNFCTLQLSLAYQKLLIFSLMQLKKDLQVCLLVLLVLFNEAQTLNLWGCSAQF